MAEEDSMTHDWYLSYRANLVIGRQAAIENYDKAIIAVNTVLLGLSFMFSGAHARWLLYAAWTGLLVSLSCTVVSLLLGQYAFNRHLDALERNYDKKRADRLWPNPYSSITNWLNVSSVVLFVVGVVLLALASALNIQ